MSVIGQKGDGFYPGVEFGTLDDGARIHPLSFVKYDGYYQVNPNFGRYPNFTTVYFEIPLGISVK
ncbi:MAG: hypothetical protein LBS21_02430 [Clostridiales bacterium]|nr:hypothetical protein [Clostridiales bacterium]